jgi:homoserine O-acetyltransferase
MTVLSRPIVLPALAAAVLALALQPSSARAQTLPREGDYVVKDFHFKNGQVLPELKQHYRTFGTARRDAAGRISNGVLLLHGSSSDGTQVLAASMTGPLFPAGAPLDTTRYFVIVPDGIGAGGSSKPSDGLHAKFPNYGYEDMVEAQHRLVADYFGIRRLKLVTGVSMGGMHTWLWGIRYPDMMDALAPIAAQPVSVRGRNLLWRRILSNAIRNDPEWKGGDYAAQPQGFLSIMPMFDMMVQSVAGLDAADPDRAAADAYLKKYTEDTAKGSDANNILYRFEASLDYNPEPEVEKIKAPLLAILFADDELNPVELGVVEKIMPRVQGGRAVVIPAAPGSSGHRNQTRAALFKDQLGEFLKSVEAK